MVEVKEYFTAVLNLEKSNNDFPVNLDEVWQLIYAERGKAVRALKANFIENVDFISLAQDGKQVSHGGSNKIDYYLSTSCLEFFVARKVRPIFEVYRQVFHHVMNGDFQQQPTTLSDKIQAANFLADFLNLNGASKLAIAKSIADPLGLPTPDYVMNEKTVHAAKDLLATHGIKMASAAFNKLLEANGIVERMTRPGKGGKVHSWVVIPKKYEMFGQNARNEHAQNQTQALWYDDKFSELLAMVGIQEGKEGDND